MKTRGESGSEILKFLGSISLFSELNESLKLYWHALASFNG